MLTDDTLTPDQVASITGKKRVTAQAAELARRGIAYAFNGRQLKVQRAVAMAYDLIPAAQQPRGVDLSKVR